MFALPLGGANAFAQSNPYNQQPNYGQDDHRRDNDNRRGDNDQRGAGAWDPGQHNGYTWRGRWHYGRPPTDVMGRAGYRPGWHRWRRGDRLPGEFRTRYVVIDDWRGAHLRRPPRGYHWVRDDRGEYLLVGIATGVILSLMLGGH
ncbi:MAG: RcnB family protein [Proteobacteria bacterium]|nr:RcnB family protein [Pseudomonadota bacterium]